MTVSPELAESCWYKSSFSGGQGGNCVEVADVASGKLVRDSTRPAGSVLHFTAGEWAAFVGNVRNGALGG